MRQLPSFIQLFTQMTAVDHHNWWKFNIDTGVFDADNVWEPTLRITAYAEELLTTQPLHGDDGIEMTPFTRPFAISRNDDPRMVTRIGTRSVYDSVFDFIHAEPGNVSLVEGAPGTSKSRNLAYLLRRLLQANKLIVFDVCYEKLKYVFVPPHDLWLHETAGGDNDRYNVYVTNRDNKIGAVERQQCVYLFDPSKGEGEPAANMACSVVIASSPNKKHFDNSTNNDTRRCYKVNPYSLPEALAFFRVLRPGPGQAHQYQTAMYLTEEQIRQGYFEVRYNKL